MKSLFLTSFAVFGMTFSSAQPVAQDKDTDGNALTKEMIALLGEIAPPLVPFVKTGNSVGEFAKWSAEGGGGDLCTESSPECKLFHKHIGFSDVKFEGSHVTVVREYQPDKAWKITDVLVRKSKDEMSVWGQMCFQSSHAVPEGQHLGAIVNPFLRGKQNRKPPAKSLQATALKQWRLNPDNVGQIPPGTCDPDLLKAKRAYLLDVKTGKLSSYPADGIWCADPWQQKCI